MGILQPVSAACRTIVALRIALSVRRDLLIECLALRHQPAVPGRKRLSERPRVTFRAQPHGTFKFLFNGIFYGKAEASG